jgi:hypothetical protein
MIRTFLSLPKRTSGIKVKKQDLDDTRNSFPLLLGLMEQHASHKLTGINITDIEVYHRTRNKLYHDGTGLSVDEQHLMAYRGIAEVLLENLFGQSSKETITEQKSMERLIVDWNTIEKTVRDRMQAAGITSTHKWEEAFAAGILGPDDAQIFHNLYKARNRLVHSGTVNKEDLDQWHAQSTELLSKYPALVEFNYKKVNISADLHRYSLNTTVTLHQPPDQDFFRLSILWPIDVPINNHHGFEEEEEQKLEGKVYYGFGLFVEKRLWPGQTMKVVGDKSNARIEYEFNDKVFDRLQSQRLDLFYTLYLQDWQPVKGRISFERLNEY